MDEINKGGLVSAFSAVVVLFLIFGGGALTGATLSNGMMGSGNMGGISWMWIPTLLALGIGILLGWTIFARVMSGVSKTQNALSGASAGLTDIVIH